LRPSRSVVWRSLLALSLAVPLATQSISGSGRAATRSADPPSAQAGSREPQGGLSAADVARLSQNADKHVIIILKDQYANLSGASRPARQVRASAVSSNQSPVLSELSQVQARNVRSFTIINAVAATVSAAEIDHLSQDPSVRSVVPDRIIPGPRHVDAASLLGASGGASAPSSSAISPAVSPTTTVTSTCAITPQLEPEALQLTNTAFPTATVPQAQNIVTGTGVTVGWIAEGLDPNNPEFIRPNGQHVFVDYQDFSGDGPNAPTGGGEAFGDAGSIAAQGAITYSLSNYVSPAHPTTCQIRLLGMSPGASLVGLKVFGQQNTTTTSDFVQAIQYADTTGPHHVDVLNESFGGNPYPDNENDPITLANDQAIRDGVTVVASSGDAGTATTIGSPSTDPNIISAGASTQFRYYQETTSYGYQLGNGGPNDFVSNNISALSSSGPNQLASQTVDVVAGGDLSYEPCTANTQLYSNCTDLKGQPSNLHSFGGTSEASPLTAGEAALVIQAYRQAHGGASPTPRQIKTIIKSTATDLNIPTYEQGAGLINSLKAVQAAQSANGSTMAAQGNGLLVSTDSASNGTTSVGTLAATDLPNTPETFPVSFTNVSTGTQTFTPTVQTLAAPGYNQSFSDTLAPTATNTLTFTDQVGNRRAYVEQDFPVPTVDGRAPDRLDAAISFDVRSQRNLTRVVRLELVDPQGRYTAFSLPQDPGNVPSSGYGHVDLTNPMTGTYRAFIWTLAGTGGYSGTVNFAVSASNYTPIGGGPAITLAPGASQTINVTATTPAQPGDESANLVFKDSSGATVAGAVPVILRSLVQFPSFSVSPTVFTGTLTGGNGRDFSPGQTLTYAFDVPSGLSDLELNTAITDTAYNLEGVLVDPAGLPINVQSTITGQNPNTGVPTGYTNTLQFFRRDPQAGRWRYVLLINDNISGLQTSLPFTATLGFNGVSVGGSLPNGNTLAAGAPTTVTVAVTNTGNTTKDFFVDGRTTNFGPLGLGGFTQNIPQSVSDPAVQPFFVPTEANNLTFIARSFAPGGIDMDAFNSNGAYPFGGTGTPDVFGSSVGPNGQHTRDQNGADTAIVNIADQYRAPELPGGLWFATPSAIGPFPSAAQQSQAQVSAVANAQGFDPSVSSSTGDAVGIFSGFTGGAYTPLTLGPGQSGTIQVGFTPSVSQTGSTVNGNLYVDTYNAGSASGFLNTGIGDELVRLPYSFNVGPQATPVPTMTMTATATVSATGTLSATATATGTVNTTTTAVASPSATTATGATSTATASPSATSTATTAPSATATASPSATATTAPSATTTATSTPTTTATNTPVPATATSTPIPSTGTATSVPATTTSVPATATGFPTIIPISTPTTTAATATATATPRPRPTARPCLVRTLFLYGSRFSFGGFTFYTLPNISVRNLRSTGGSHPRVTSPAPLFFDDGRTAFYSGTRYRSLACGGTTLVDVTGTVFIGYTTGQHGRLVDLTGRTFRLRVRSARGGYSAFLEIYNARVNPRTYNGLHGTVSVQQ